MKTFRLSEITQIIGMTFRQVFEEFQFYCSAELAKAKFFKGRWYLEFVEIDHSGTVLAKAKGIIRSQNIVAHFLHETGHTAFEELIGKQLLFLGSLSFHELYGRSISIHELSSIFEIGVQTKNILELRQTLQKSGIYAQNMSYKLELPPFRLALISGKTSEGLRDFTHIVDESHYHISYDVFESYVHGNKAIQSVQEALETIQKKLEKEKSYNAILILRGGGGNSGLQRRNEKDLVRAVCLCKLPVFVAVGHTTDISLLDEVAFRSFATPTAAAHFFVEFTKETYEQTAAWLNEINHKAKYIQEEALEAVQRHITDIDLLVKRKFLLLQERIESRRRSISQFGPEEMYSRGYTTLHSGDGSYLSEKEIVELTSDSEIGITTHHFEIKAKILSIHSRKP